MYKIAISLAAASATEEEHPVRQAFIEMAAKADDDDLMEFTPAEDMEVQNQEAKEDNIVTPAQDMEVQEQEPNTKAGEELM